MSLMRHIRIKSKDSNENSWVVIRHTQFSKVRLVVVILFVMAGIGGYFPARSLATSSSVGDANNDGQVNNTDLTTLLSNYGSTNSSCDFNQDGVVNVLDLSILLSHYDTTGGGLGSGSSFADVYGAPYSPSSLDNVRSGDTSNYIPGYRFRADHTGNLQGFRLYWIDGSGYAAGNGGTISMTIQTDDGSANHFPSGTVLGQPVVYHPNLVNGIDPTGTTGYFQFFTLPTAVPVVQGQLYHLVFNNTASNSATNFESVDGLSALTSGTDGSLKLINTVQSGVSRTDWGTEFEYNGSGGWVSLAPPPSGDDIAPILDLQWTDGHHLGNGYMEVWIGKPVALTAAGSAREQFTPKANKTINAINIEAITMTSGSLSARLETSSGTLVQQATITTTGDGKGHWFTFNIPNTTLQAGQTYNLVWQAPTGSAEVYAMRDGSTSGYGFNSSTTFTDGLAQQFKSGAWQNWEDAWSTSPVNYADLSFYFSVAN